MQRGIVYLSYLAAIIAILAWAFVIWFVFSLQSMQAQQLADAQVSANASSKDSRASDLHAELLETADARTQLSALISVDPTSLGTTIDSAGTTAGVDLQIQSAAPDTAAAAAAPGSPTQAFDFSVAGQGTFAQVLYAAQLLGALPVPSSIVNLQLIRSPQSTTGGPWQLNANIQTVTAANLSS